MKDLRPAKRVLLNNPGGQRYRGRRRARWEDDMEEDARRIGVRNWIGRAKNREYWTMFSPSKGKSQTSEDIPPQTQPSAASRFMTWTPKLLRRSFRRSSNSSSSSPWDNSSSHSSSRLSFRTPSSRSSLPLPSSSRTSLQPPSSSTLHRTTPPSRPAPPSFRPPLSASNSQNVPNNIESNPVPPRRRALYTASSPGKTGMNNNW
ncbi:hypothetical protein C0J52_12926 [Blattella germanica]|nr:hypothetical protein C0J52_12926 [Blattella germanica]